MRHGTDHGGKGEDDSGDREAWKKGETMVLSKTGYQRSWSAPVILVTLRDEEAVRISIDRSMDYY